MNEKRREVSPKKGERKSSVVKEKAGWPVMILRQTREIPEKGGKNPSCRKTE